MKQSKILCALVAVPLLATGCKKKDEPAAAGTGSATASAAATGTGSATGSAAATGAGSATGSAAAEAAAPWAADTAAVAATSKVAGKRNGTDEGTFDRALYFKGTDKYGTVVHRVLIASNCEKFSCAHVDWLRGGIFTNDEKLYGDCANAKVMSVDLEVDGDPKAGPLGVDISINGPTSGGDLSGEEWLKGSSLTAVSDKEIKGTIAVKDGESAANGEFTAKVCGTAVEPKAP